MHIASARLTVLFEDPFWIGIYERTHDGRYEVCKITFGAEPKDYEVHAFYLENYDRFTISPALSAETPAPQRVSPKRLQRQARQATAKRGIGTKAQQALKMQQEAGKLQRRQRSHAQREAEAQRQFEVRQEKRREKHRGH